MSEAYSPQEPTMVWNTQMKWWDTSEIDLLLGLSVPFLGTWQTSGMMRNGQVFELPMQGHHTADSESLLLRSPKASEGEGGALGEAEALKRGNTVGVRDQVMDLMAAQGAKVSRKDLMPTPNTMDMLPARDPSKIDKSKGGHANVRETVVNELSETNWGRFEPAIKRWENILQRQAPVPTKPDGKDGAHRLSSSFTEWMMGVPEGWITDCGLTRNEELKACGNGVVPQQAELALKMLLIDVDLIPGKD